MSARHHPFAIQLAGRRWSGDWSVQGLEVCVGSAYGCLAAPMGRRTPEKVAQGLLAQIVRTWLDARGHP